VSAEQLWKGVTSVSNAGRKRGRGKGVGKKTSKDLNKGQVIGVGKYDCMIFNFVTCIYCVQNNFVGFLI